MWLRFHFDSTWVSLRFHFVLTSVARRVTSISLRVHFDLLRCHFDVTSAPLQLRFDSNSISLRLHFELTSISRSVSLQFHTDFTTCHFDFSSKPLRSNLHATSISLQSHSDLIYPHDNLQQVTCFLLPTTSLRATTCYHLVDQGKISGPNSAHFPFHVFLRYEIHIQDLWRIAYGDLHHFMVHVFDVSTLNKIEIQKMKCQLFKKTENGNKNGSSKIT